MSSSISCKPFGLSTKTYVLFSPYSITTLGGMAPLSQNNRASIWSINVIDTMTAASIDMTHIYVNNMVKENNVLITHHKYLLALRP